MSYGLLLLRFFVHLVYVTCCWQPSVWHDKGEILSIIQYLSVIIVKHKFHLLFANLLTCVAPEFSSLSARVSLTAALGALDGACEETIDTEI